ncbi:MAG TPA: ribonuclease III [Holosporales bacterium]|nr:ribonuclease III [Holosporales bacterium]
MSTDSLVRLQDNLGYTFQDKALLDQALRHSSATKQNQQSYERLEFLGDRILGLCVAELLYQIYPFDKEGALAQRHSALVCEDVLAQIAQDLSLGVLIQGETKNFSKNRPSVLADAVEALIAVVYLEKGLSEVQKVIKKFWRPLIAEMTTAPKDPKSALQEWAHKHNKNAPLYSLIKRSGPDHDPLFTVQVSLDKTRQETAQGSSLKQAEKNAAIALLKGLNKQSVE